MSETIHFEKSMQELEEIVRQLERGDLMLEDSLKQYEKGIQLARKCQDVLTQAEQKIEMLRMNTMETSEPSNE